MKTPPDLKLSHIKTVVCGNIIEEYIYEKPYAYNVAPFRRDFSKESESSPLDKHYNINRARRFLRWIVNANLPTEFKPQFLTLTYDINQTDRKKTISDFRACIRYLNEHLSTKLQYTAVLENQKRGAFHVHLIIYNANPNPNKIIKKNIPIPKNQT